MMRFCIIFLITKNRHLRKTITLVLLTLFIATKPCTAQAIDNFVGNIENLRGNFFAKGGPNAMAIVQQNLAAAHAEINKLKDKIYQLAGGSGDLGMPDFKLNSQKTKPTNFDSGCLPARISILRKAI